MVDYLRGRGLDGATALEVGGGVGAIQIELLKAGARGTTNVELSSGYEEEAAALLRESSLEDRVQRRVADFVAAAESVEPADVVVMHRVVCCYPDPEQLVGAAATHARGRLVLSYPPDNVLSRTVMPLFNLWCVIRRVDFRAYIHRRTAILGAAEREGFEVELERRSGVWVLAALERVAPT